MEKKVVKLIILGDGGVGKTTLANHYIKRKFDPDIKMTKGIDFQSKEFRVNGDIWRLVLWDMAGQDHFQFLIDDFIKGAVGAMILVDLTRFSTFIKIKKWIELLDTNGRIPILIVGNKLDIIKSEESIISYDTFVSDLKEQFTNIFDSIKISSKTGENIDSAFQLLVDAIKVRI